MRLLPIAPRNVVLDTNIVISAAIVRDGLQANLLELVFRNQLVNYTSPALLEELRGVLERPSVQQKLHAEGKMLIQLFVEYSVLVHPSARPATIVRDPDDDHVLACALEAHAEAIVTGDADILSLTEYEGIRILNSRQFFDYY